VIVVRCDKCKAEVEQCEAGHPNAVMRPVVWPEGWARLWNAFGTAKTDLCATCKEQWDKIREPALQTWLAAP
jgi:hypothetical protein